VITGHDTARAAFLSGDVKPAWDLTAHSSHFDWTWQQRGILVNGAYEGDDHHTVAGLHFSWGDGAVIGPTNQWGWAWSPRQWNATDEDWYIGVANNSVFSAEIFGGQPTQNYELTGGPLIKPKSRPGVWGTADSSVLRIFYISNADKLDWTDVDLADLPTSGGAWCGSDDGSACDLYDANNVWLGAESYTVAPVSATEVFVFGYTSPLIWVCRFSYEGNDVWDIGPIHYIKYAADLPYPIIFNADAVDTELGDQCVLLAPTAASTVQSLTFYDGVYSAPHWLHAPPETSGEGGQRVWAHSLNLVKHNDHNRVYAVLSTDVDGGREHFYARRTHLYSASWPGTWTEQLLSEGYPGTWTDWRDEGMVMSGSLPGKLAHVDGHLSLRSAASWAFASENWRVVAATATGVTGVTAPRSIDVRRSMAGTSQMELKLLSAPGLEPGDWVQYSLGVAADKAPVFRGYVDNVVSEEYLGGRLYKVLARGPLSRLIGETSYVPLTTLTWDGRQSWRTRFVDIDKIAVNGLATAHGDLVAEHEGDHGVLRCKPTSDKRPAVATAPLPIHTDDCVFSCIMQSDGDGAMTGVSFWHDDPKHLSTAYWYVDLVLSGTDSWLRLWQVTPGKDATGKEVGIHTAKYGLNITTDQGCVLKPTDKLLWEVILRSGFIQMQISQYPYPTGPVIDPPQAILTYDAWKRASEADPGEQFGPAPNWLVGLTLKPAALGKVYEFALCDGNTPLSMRSALTSLSELSGASLTWPAGITAATPGAGVTVQALDCNLVPTAAGSGLTIGDYTLLMYPTHAVLVRYKPNGVDVLTTQSRFFGRTLDLASAVRVCAVEDCVSLYHGDRLLCAFFEDLPEVVGFVTVHGSAMMSWQYFSDLPLLGGISWGFNENAAAVLGNMLRGRRIYLIEWPDGSIHVNSTFEGANAFPFETYTHYRHVTVRQVAEDDLRNQASIVGVIGADTDTSAVYIINAAGSRRRAKTLTIDSPWAVSRAMALREAELAMQDMQRRTDQRELLMLPDPCLCPGDVIALSDGWQGVVHDIGTSYSLEDRSIRLTSQVRCWGKWVAEIVGANWSSLQSIDAEWNDFSWG
jgi:hypothetical protein